MVNKNLKTTIHNNGPYNLTVARVSLGWPTGQFPAGSGAAYMNYDAVEWREFWHVERDRLAGHGQQSRLERERQFET